MLKEKTLNELDAAFKDNETSEIIPETAGSVEVVTLDLIRIHINDRIHPLTVKSIIFEILHNNEEPGPLKVHIETARTYKATLYADIKTI